MSRASIFSVIISRSPKLRNDCEGQHSIVYIYGATESSSTATLHAKDHGGQPSKPDFVMRLSLRVFATSNGCADLITGMRDSPKNAVPKCQNSIQNPCQPRPSQTPAAPFKRLYPN
jgi:hypothetical protein